MTSRSAPPAVWYRLANATPANVALCIGIRAPLEVPGWVSCEPPTEELASPHQVHSNVVHVLTDPSEVRELGFRSTKGDGVVTTLQATTLCIRVADCLPIALWSSDGGVIALLHAGWRGVVGGIIPAGPKAITRLGVAADDLSAWIGPGIGPCCFEVGPEVAAQFPAEVVLQADGEARPHIDLATAAKNILVREGIPSARIAIDAHCTRCQPDRFFSYRAHPDDPGRNWITLRKMP